MRPDVQRYPAARHRTEDPCNAFKVVRTRCSIFVYPASSTTQYQLLVSFCRKEFLRGSAAAVLTSFFIARLLLSLLRPRL